MMKIDHLGIAVHSISDSLTFYHGALVLELSGMETVEDQGVRVALLPVGESRIELLEPVSGETPVGRFIAKRGEGLHHVAYQVDDVGDALRAAEGAGVELIDEAPRTGGGGRTLVGFLHPKSVHGVLTELEQDVGRD